MPSLQFFFLHFYVDNLIFRHQIKMNWKGRLSIESPVIQSHAVMLLTLIVVFFAHSELGPHGVFLASGGTLLLASVIGYFIGFYFGYRSIWRERVKGTLEQLCLTLISDSELFEGKFLGCMAPYFEARRYLMLHLVLFVCADACITREPGPPILALAIGLLLLNHLNFAYPMAVLAGLRAAQTQKKSMLASMITESEYTVLLPEIGLFLKAIFPAIKTFIMLVFVWLLTEFLVSKFELELSWLRSRDDDFTWILLLPALIFPLHMMSHLCNHEVERHDRLQRFFKKKIVFAE